MTEEDNGIASSEADRGIAQQIFEAKWVCNGFPKSGTHLLVQMIHPIAPYQTGTDAGLFEQPWAGTFMDNSWTNRWSPIELTTFKLGRIANGKMLKAHLGFSPELERFMYLLGCIHIFIYRDLRDVAVSQAWHIINASQATLAHPEPEAFGPLDDFDGVLEKVITGIGRFPGVVERWGMYAGWLQAWWVLKVRYEDALVKRKETAERIFKYGMKLHADRWAKKVGFDPHGLDVVTNVMVKASQQTDKSPTFRKGVAGGWREAFKDRHIEAWREHDPDRWLVRLSYEENAWYGRTGEADAEVIAQPADIGPGSDETAARVECAAGCGRPLPAAVA